jgi:molybdopterin molybdotransferase
MKTLEEALAVLLAQGQQSAVTATERLPIELAVGRILAHTIESPIHVPAYDNSQMDGYAGIAVEMNNATEPMVVSQRIAAGHPGQPLQPGTVARIFTGAAIPKGANAVIMQEEVRVHENDRIQCLAPLTPGQNIRPMAGDLRQGQPMLKIGHRLSAADIGLCASVGLTHVVVREQLRVAVFTSGDELKQPGESIRFGQIFDSNRPMIMALLKGLGFAVSDMGCLPDRLDATRQALGQAAATHNVILTCGGVSVGEEDHIKLAIEEQGGLDLWKVAIKPGKPFAFGRVGQATFMGMPGNPVAAWATFMLLVRPYLLVHAGLRADACPASQETLAPSGFMLPAAFDWPKPDARQEFLRGWINQEGRAQIHDRQNSAVLSSVTESSGLVAVPAATPIRAGQMVRFLPYTAFA